MVTKTSFKKGSARGRPKGCKNKTTNHAKELIMIAIDRQSVHFDTTMRTIRIKNPVEWAKIMVKLMDFVLPKKLDLTTNGEPLYPPQIIIESPMDKAD